MIACNISSSLLSHIVQLILLYLPVPHRRPQSLPPENRREEHSCRTLQHLDIPINLFQDVDSRLTDHPDRAITQLLLPLLCYLASQNGDLKRMLNPRWH
jgi:hypothetical protein